MRLTNFRWLLFLGIFVVVGLFTYRKAIHSEFYFDDTQRIVQLSTQNGSSVFQPLPAFQNGFLSTLQHVLPDRPVLVATIWLNYLVGGVNPVGYKLVNILLHSVNAFLLFLFLKSHSCALWEKKL